MPVWIKEYLYSRTNRLAKYLSSLIIFNSDPKGGISFTFSIGSCLSTLNLNLSPFSFSKYDRKVTLSIL